MKTKANTIGCLYIIFSASVALLSLSSQAHYHIALISIIQIITFMSLFTAIVKSIFCFDFIFIVFLFVLHLPQYIVAGLNLDVEIMPAWNVIHIVPYDIYLQAGVYTLLVMQATMLGIIMFRLFWMGKTDFRSFFSQTPVTNDEPKTTNTIKKVAISLIIIGALPSLYLDLSKLLSYFTEGYLATFMVPGAGSGILNYSASLWKYGAILLIMGFSDRPRKALVIMLISIIYLLSSMLSGNRINAAMFITTIIVVYYLAVVKKDKTYNRKRVYTIALLLAAAYISLVFINYMNAVRSNEIISIWQIAASPVSYTTKALSNTISTVCYAVWIFPKSGATGYGLTYLTGWLTVLPNIGRFLSDFAVYNQFTTNIPMPYIMSLGGSYIGELFYNFRYLGIVFTVLFGFVISCMSGSIERSIMKRDYISVMMFLPAIPYVLQWPRAYFAEICRPFLWTPALVFFLKAAIEEPFFFKRRHT